MFGWAGKGREGKRREGKGREGKGGGSFERRGMGIEEEAGDPRGWSVFGGWG